MLSNLGLLSVATVLFFGFTQSTHADEYGERFYNHTPTGMAEYTAPSYETPDIAMDDIAAELQDIMPAAGDETETEEEEIAEEKQVSEQSVEEE